MLENNNCLYAAALAELIGIGTAIAARCKSCSEPWVDRRIDRRWRSQRR
jgi:hypothetical protein